MLGAATDIFVFFVLIALGGFAFFMWREWVYFSKKNPRALLRVGAGLLCFVFTAPLMLLAFAPVLLAAASGLLEALGRRKLALMAAALCLGALMYQMFYRAQNFFPR